MDDASDSNLNGMQIFVGEWIPSNPITAMLQKPPRPELTDSAAPDNFNCKMSAAASLGGPRNDHKVHVCTPWMPHVDFYFHVYLCILFCIYLCIYIYIVYMI